jgi:hypothetical protein
MGYIYNVCLECGEPIRVAEKKDRTLNKMLKESKTAVCSLCDESSGWRRY